MELFKVTHIRIDRIPINGVAQLFFFTEKKGEIFWGTDNNSINRKNIDRWVAEKKVLKLKNPLFIDEETTLLIGGQDSNVYTSKPLKEEMKLEGRLDSLVEQ